MPVSLVAMLLFVPLSDSFSFQISSCRVRYRPLWYYMIYIRHISHQEYEMELRLALSNRYTL